MTRHVVFGTGQVGRHVVEQLIDRGHDVVAARPDHSATAPRH